MFESPDFKKSLDEETFNRWLEDGRQRNLGYRYLLIVWDDLESAYQPVYVADRQDIAAYKTSSREKLIAAYDLYSESRIV